MVVPVNAVYQNGTFPVTGDAFNTFVQTVTTVSVLRQFVGKANMVVELQGIATPGDTGAGAFFWNSGSTAADDGVNIIVPPAAASGAWNRLATTPAFVVATIATLQALTSTAYPGSYIYVTGYNAAGDGGEGSFYVGAATTANGGTIINDASGRSWYRETGKQPYSIAWFGAIADGATDNAAAIQNCLNAGNGAFYIPPGTWALSAVTIPTNCAMSGAGQGISILRGLTASGKMLTYTGTVPTNTKIAFTDMSFDGGAAGITALSCTFATNIIVNNCIFTGISKPIAFDRCVSSNITNLTIRGNSSYAGGQIALTNSTGGVVSDISTISRVLHDCSATYGVGGAQTSPLILISETEGTTVTHCIGLNLDTIASNTIQHIKVIGLCQGIVISENISNGASVGIQVTYDGGDAPSYVDIRGNQVDSFGTAGIQLLGSNALPLNLINISGGLITAPEGVSVPCLDVQYTGVTNSIVGVQMYQWQGYPTPSGIGLQLTGAQGVSVSSCGFGQLTTCVNFVGGSNSHIAIADCNSTGCTNSIVGTTTGSNRFVDNYWYATPSPTLPSLPATGVAYVNDTGFNLNISISGGTVSNIYVNTHATGLTSGNFFLPPGGTNSITVAYSVSPTWTVSAVL